MTVFRRNNGILILKVFSDILKFVDTCFIDIVEFFLLSLRDVTLRSDRLGPFNRTTIQVCKTLVEYVTSSGQRSL